jgi:NAD(P) transhydrogenase subunit beta
MNANVANLLYLLAASMFIVGLKKMSSPATARGGNRIGAGGMLIAIVVALVSGGIISWPWVIAGIVVGSAVGLVSAQRVPMTGMPQFVAIFNGLGGLASALVASVEFIHSNPTPETANLPNLVTIGLSVLVGAITFTGSMIAYGKLQGVLTGAPILLPMRHVINLVLTALAIVLIVAVCTSLSGWWLVVLLLISGALGVLLTIPIGGADMPVVISLLNSYSGIAAALTGFVLNNEGLIISGSLVGSSGIILTKIMCKGMNRSLANVLFGGFGTADAKPGTVGPGGAAGAVSIRELSASDAAAVMADATSVIIVPGYGMAVAQAQHIVRELADQLIKKGVSVKYAIHPVAGRMPGHMNVLLAEANVPYDQLCDLDDINPDFDHCDVALVIGANDVTNPAARSDPSSPIYGMPILNCDHARTVIVSKRSLNPGFAGIDNALYGLSNTYMLFGDAKKMMTEVVSELKAN